MSKTQKIIKAIIYPFIIVVITIGVAGSLAEWLLGGRYIHAFDFDKTWFIWVIALIIIYQVEKDIFESWINLVHESYKYDNKGEYLKSMKLAQKALELNPRASEAWHLIGNAYEHLSHEREVASKTERFNKKEKHKQAAEYHKKATEAWDKAKEINPDTVIPGYPE